MALDCEVDGFVHHLGGGGASVINAHCLCSSFDHLVTAALDIGEKLNDIDLVHA
jgi:hypothetical protein